MSETMVKKQLESSEIQTGACVFCGQVYQFETDGRVPEAQLDGWATDKCDCVDATLERRRKKKEQAAKDSIKELIMDEHPEIADMLNDTIGLILQEKITKLSVTAGNGEKMAMIVNQKGNIKIEYTKTKKKSKEV